MPKLPNNLVKPPASAFDNPLRRTAPRDAALAESPGPAPAQSETTPPRDPGASETGGVVIPIGTTRTDSQPEPGEMDMSHRITVRIDDNTRRALEADCYKRRIAGEKTNLAEIARGILKQWAGRSGRAGRAE